MNILNVKNAALAVYESQEIRINLNREYTPLYRFSRLYDSMVIDSYRGHIQASKGLSEFDNFTKFINTRFTDYIIYTPDSYYQQYKNSKSLKSVSILDYLYNNSYSSGLYTKRSGAFMTNSEIFYMLFVKSSYANDLNLRIWFDLPIDYSNFEFCISPEMLTTPYSAWFNPIIPDLLKMNEAGVNILITDDILSRLIIPDLAYVSDLESRKEKEQELGRILSQKLRDKFYGQVADSADLPF